MTPFFFTCLRGKVKRTALEDALAKYAQAPAAPKVAFDDRSELLSKLAEALRSVDAEQAITYESLDLVKNSSYSLLGEPLAAQGDHELNKLAHAIRLYEVQQDRAFVEKNARYLSALKGIALLEAKSK